jgi:hypothetical protein
LLGGVLIFGELQASLTGSRVSDRHSREGGNPNDGFICTVFLDGDVVWIPAFAGMTVREDNQ